MEHIFRQERSLYETPTLEVLEWEGNVFLNFSQDASDGTYNEGNEEHPTGWF